MGFGYKWDILMILGIGDKIPNNNKMLINNLREHRQKYQKSSNIAQSHSKSKQREKYTKNNSQLHRQYDVNNPHVIYHQTKTQTDFKFKSICKYQLDKTTSARVDAIAKFTRTQSGCRIRNGYLDKEVSGAGVGEVRQIERKGLFSSYKKGNYISQQLSRNSYNQKSRIQPKPQKKQQKFSTQPQLLSTAQPIQQQTNTSTTLTTTSGKIQAQVQVQRKQSTTKLERRNKKSVINMQGQKQKWAQKQEMKANKSNKTNYKSIVLGRNILDVDENVNQVQFIQALNYHDVFFCCGCCRYVFAIEKNYHFPNCRTLLPNNLPEPQKYKLGLQKLSLLVELAQYTKQKQNQIKQLYNSILKHKSIPEAYELGIQSNRNYLRLTQIEIAACIIIERLINGTLDEVAKNGDGICTRARCDNHHEL